MIEKRLDVALEFAEEMYEEDTSDPMFRFLVQVLRGIKYGDFTGTGEEVAGEGLADG